MEKKNGIKIGLYNKGQAARRLGFMSTTSGYRYMDFLIKNNVIQPIKLEGITAPRFRVEDIESLREKTEDLGSPKFEGGNK